MEKKNKKSVNGNYLWYRDRATLIALTTGCFSTVITLINALSK